MALAAVVAVEVHGHEGARTALLGALLPQASHLAGGLVNLVVLEHRELDLLVLGLDLLGLGVGLLLALLATTQELEVAAQAITRSQAACAAQVRLALAVLSPLLRAAALFHSPFARALGARIRA